MSRSRLACAAVGGVALVGLGLPVAYADGAPSAAPSVAPSASAAPSVAPTAAPVPDLHSGVMLRAAALPQVDPSTDPSSVLGPEGGTPTDATSAEPGAGGVEGGGTPAAEPTKPAVTEEPTAEPTKPAVTEPAADPTTYVNPAIETTVAPVEGRTSAKPTASAAPASTTTAPAPAAPTSTTKAEATNTTTAGPQGGCSATTARDIPRGDAEYSAQRDIDNDGVACESEGNGVPGPARTAAVAYTTSARGSTTLAATGSDVSGGWMAVGASLTTLGAALLRRGRRA